MKRLLTACLLGAIAFAAGAQDAPPAEVDARAEVQAQFESDEQAAEATEDKRARADAEVERDCLRHTGTHITTRTLDETGKDCVTANGRVYSREEIQRTGQTNIADALRMLDTSVF